ncbi:hypothetical protein BRADI_3g06915v3, partial [Brachypodium distachyon]
PPHFLPPIFPLFLLRACAFGRDFVRRRGAPLHRTRSCTREVRVAGTPELRRGRRRFSPRRRKEHRCVAQTSCFLLQKYATPRALLKASVVGFAEGVVVIFLSTEAGLFRVELNSGRSRKIYSKMFFEKVMLHELIHWRIYAGLIRFSD